MKTLVLELNGQCIETTARREFKRLSGSLLESEDRMPVDEQRAELLRAFLVATDFGALRSQRP